MCTIRDMNAVYQSDGEVWVLTGNIRKNAHILDEISVEIVMLRVCLSNCKVVLLEYEDNPPNDDCQILQGIRYNPRRSYQEKKKQKTKEVQANQLLPCRMAIVRGASRHPSTLRATGCARGALECGPDCYLLELVVEWQECFFFFNQISILL